MGASHESSAANLPSPDSATLCGEHPGIQSGAPRSMGASLESSAANLPSADSAALATSEEPEDAPPGPAVVIVRSLPGEVLAVFEPGPPSVEQLKSGIEQRTSCPPALQRLIVPGRLQPLADGEPLPEQERLEVTLVVDESPLFTWDVEGNPNGEALELDGALLRCPRLRTDYINVHPREPVRSGVHYFQFVMHTIGDEQWCGVVTEHSAGRWISGRMLSGMCHGCLYYCGRMGKRSEWSSLVDGHGALHAGNHAVAPFETVQPHGDVIGMLLDLGTKAVAFDLNGKLQGACSLPDGPLWVLTHLDTPSDCVELRKLPLSEAPEDCRAAVAGPLLDLTQGPNLWGRS